MRAAEYIIDTSVILKWFVGKEEADLAAARGLRDDYLHGRCSLRSPDFMLLELANSLHTGRRFTSAEIGLILRSLRNLQIQIEPVRWETLMHALDIAAGHGTAVYDSYFLALAIESGAVLVTADERFLHQIGPHPSALSLRHFRLADWST